MIRVVLLLLLPAFLSARLPEPAGELRALRQGDVRVLFYPGQDGLARQLLHAAARPLPLPGFSPRPVHPSATIVLAPTDAAFDSLLGGRAPEWSAAVAIPSRNLIVIPTRSVAQAGPEAAVATLRHELVHLALHQRLPGPIPRWFDEGYATWASGGWEAESAWKLRVAFLVGSAPALDSLILDWPREAQPAHLAYLLSATAVRYLAERGGEEGFAALLDRWQEEGTLDRAVRATYGLTLGQFEKEWREVVKQRYGWMLILSQVTVFWLVMALFLILAGTLRRRHRRQRMLELEAEDRMLPPPRDPGVDDLPPPEYH